MGCMINKNRTTTYIEKDNVGFLQYKKLNEYPWLMNAFSTRKGGFSKGQYAEMNLSFTVGDDPETVKENFRIFGDAIGIKREQMVYAAQTHTNNVMRVDPSCKGMGVLHDRNFDKIDGLVTDDPGVCLVGSYADCVPLYFVDPVRHCIGLSHSGWRGTVTEIGRNTIELMRKEFGTDPNDLICCIGPCIGKECYEVSADVVEEFKKAYTSAQCDRIYIPVEGKEGKYLLDLPMANCLLLEECGVRPENIILPDLCTSCNKELLHSHRASGGKRGGMCAFLMIRESD